ncbi:MAG TPA: cyclic lactone autoinducer peptide [Pseudobacteroides sp.]
MKKRLMFIVCVIIGVMATFVASISCYASIPFLSYQPKAPKSLIKE